MAACESARLGILETEMTNIPQGTEANDQSILQRKILLSSNTSWNIVNFRSGLVKALADTGAEVLVAAPADGSSQDLEGLNCRHISLPMDNKGANPINDFRLFLRYLAVMRAERPAAYLAWTIKPNVYGSLAAAVCGIPVVNNISGLGTAFLRDGWLTRIAKTLYRISLARSSRVFFQNHDDLKLFLSAGLVRGSQAEVIPGSGIDLDAFGMSPMPERPPSSGPVFLLVGRMLWDKGVGEYVEAARRVRRRYPSARFQLLGFMGADNRTAVPEAVMSGWQEEGVIEYLGPASDVRPYLEAADCVVLPSYREGTPRSLLEAAATGRPIITTDTPGCRNVVDDGVNGYLCEVRSAEDLARAMQDFADMDSAQRAEMGRQGRLKVAQQFDERIVVGSYIDVLARSLGRP